MTNVTKKGAEVKLDCRNWFSSKSRGTNQTKSLTCCWRRGDQPFPYDVDDSFAADTRPLAFSRVPGTWGEHRYKLAFQTHRGWWCGTRARVGVTLHGSSAAFTPLLDQRKDHFLSGGTDVFFVATDASIGELDRVEVRFAGGGDSWKLDKVHVTELLTGREWVFLCNKVVRKPGVRLEEKQLAKRGIPQLGANECDYEFTFYSGDVAGGGTDAAVYCEVMGRHGVSDTLAFDREEELFERARSDTFTRALDRDLGELLEMKVWHDGSGWGSAWALDMVEVKNVRSQRTWVFNNHSRWVRKGSPVTVAGRVIVEGTVERKGGGCASGASSAPAETAASTNSVRHRVPASSNVTSLDL